MSFLRTRIQRQLRLFSSGNQLLKKVVPPSLSEINVVDLDRYARQPTPPEAYAKELDEISRKEQQQYEQHSSASPSLIKAFLYGSPEAQKEASQFDRKFSEQLMRNRLVHEISFHSVIPARAVEYVQLMTEFNKGATASNSGRLLGAWRVILGNDVDTYVHVWEYENMASLHRAKQESHQKNDFINFSGQLTQYLRSRSSEILQEFTFWGGTPEPRNYGGIFELRKYDLKPGSLAEWEFFWRKGLQYRKEVMEPVGAWYSRIGPLNRVYHLWQFTDLQHRKISRERSWAMEGWAETTQQTHKLLDKMECMILLPLEYSPLK